MATARKTPAAKKKAAPAKSPAPKAAAPVKAPKAKPAGKPAKDKKPKLVRDSFTIPKGEYVVLQALKDRAASLGRPAKKSEVLRAGLMALAMMNDTAFMSGIAAVPQVKTGRPAKNA